MKGQYLAVESVMTFGLGLVVAIGTVTAFTSYQDQLLGTASDKQVDRIEAEVTSAVYSLEPVESGHKDVNLPERLGGTEYRLVFDEGLKILVNGEVHSADFSGLRSSHDFTGSVEGGPVKIFKRGNQYTLRTD